MFLQNIVLSWLLTQELSKELPFLDNKSSNKTGFYDILILADKLDEQLYFISGFK